MVIGLNVYFSKNLNVLFLGNGVFLQRKNKGLIKDLNTYSTTCIWFRGENQCIQCKLYCPLFYCYITY